MNDAQRDAFEIMEKLLALAPPPPKPVNFIEYDSLAYHRIGRLVEGGREEAADRIVQRRGGIGIPPWFFELLRTDLRFQGFGVRDGLDV